MTIVLVGPTASGKSGLAVALAQAYGARGQRAEVVNADSMLVYRGMDVGTAKPTERERAGVVHHLVDVLDVTQTATVAQFQGMARAAVADCLARGVVPILVGGSALYVRAVLDAFEFPGTDPELRARLEAELEALGPEALHARLAARDPAAAARIEPGNGRRVVRALEVGELTGQPYAAELPERRYALPDVVQVGLDVPRDVLDVRIRRRVDAMWEAGLVAEVRLLEQAGLRDGLTASRALGYRQVLQHLDGELDEAAAREATVVGTRKFARRQDSWFRKDERITWLDHDRPDLVEATLVVTGPEGRGRVGSSPAD
ncbi:tRNA (adenosine(37)-N6)-dimethylallyltransferase MiaA [Microlunatus spumicola]|uniref:tRNA dimethylallyltransferase n=1 Tax=Microlunatus spumicola TaxID=81499 RepID=A0ABP6WDG3_9ACTN